MIVLEPVRVVDHIVEALISLDLDGASVDVIEGNLARLLAIGVLMLGRLGQLALLVLGCSITKLSLTQLFLGHEGIGHLEIGQVHVFSGVFLTIGLVVYLIFALSSSAVEDIVVGAIKHHVIGDYIISSIKKIGARLFLDVVIL